MAKKDTFDNMYTLYTAINDIDKIVNDPNEIDQNDQCKLDQVLLYVKDIPKKDYNPELSATIISCIRQAIVELYEKEASTITESIAAGSQLDGQTNDTSKQKLAVTGGGRNIKPIPNFRNVKLPDTPVPEVIMN